MKWNEAKLLAHSCDMGTDMEIIGNIHMHCMNLFDYSKISEELNELRADAISLGIDYDKILTCFNKRFLNPAGIKKTEEEYVQTKDKGKLK